MITIPYQPGYWPSSFYASLWSETDCGGVDKHAKVSETSVQTKFCKVVSLNLKPFFLQVDFYLVF